MQREDVQKLLVRSKDVKRDISELEEDAEERDDHTHVDYQGQTSVGRCIHWKFKTLLNNMSFIKQNDIESFVCCSTFTCRGSVFSAMQDDVKHHRCRSCL